MKKLISVIFIIMLTGCASSREIKTMAECLSKEELKNPNHVTIDKIKKYYFTKKAYEAIKRIPAIDGPAINGYAAGVNVWSNIASFVTCNGIGRKIIVPKKSVAQWGVSILIHEYVHHLDDMTRDGEANFINYDEFRKAYELMAKDSKWHGLYLWIESRANSLVTELFGVGEMSEHIAYTAQCLVTRGGPDYMKYVFRKILRIPFTNCVDYTSMDGYRFKINIPHDD